MPWPIEVRSFDRRAANVCLDGTDDRTTTETSSVQPPTCCVTFHPSDVIEARSRAIHATGKYKRRKVNDSDPGIRVCTVSTGGQHSCTLTTAATLMPEWESRPWSPSPGPEVWNRANATVHVLLSACNFSRLWLLFHSCGYERYFLPSFPTITYRGSTTVFLSYGVFFFQDFWDVVYYVLLWGFCHFYVYSISILVHVVHTMHWCY